MEENKVPDVIRKKWEDCVKKMLEQLWNGKLEDYQLLELEKMSTKDLIENYNVLSEYFKEGK